MNRLEKVLLVMTLSLAAIIAGVILSVTGDETSAPIDTDANIGKCIQGQRVLYQVDRAQAAEKCLADLDNHGPARFARTWQNYETVPGSW